MPAIGDQRIMRIAAHQILTVMLKISPSKLRLTGEKVPVMHPVGVEPTQRSKPVWPDGWRVLVS